MELLNWYRSVHAGKRAVLLVQPVVRNIISRQFDAFLDFTHKVRLSYKCYKSG